MPRKDYYEFQQGFHSILKCCVTETSSAYDYENFGNSDHVLILHQRVQAGV